MVNIRCAWASVFLLATPVLVVAADPDGREAGTSSTVVSSDAATPAVFAPPPAHELDKITHPSLRAELLHMVHEDQVARSAGT